MDTDHKVLRHALVGYKADFGAERKLSENLEFSSPKRGQSCPQDYPQSRGSLLGAALSIREVAELLGCSPWTVRQRYLPQGLPHVRASSLGKIVFFRGQVIDWILKRQQQKKGGLR